MPKPTLMLALLTGCTYLGADSLDRDGDGVVDSEDCDFSSPLAAEGSQPIEVFADVDGDGFGDALNSRLVCETQIPEGFRLDSQDCDDRDPEIHPDAVERCLPLGVDDDCDGGSEDEDPDKNFGDDASLLYYDEDSDGFPAASVPTEACGSLGEDWVQVGPQEEFPGLDCAPADPAIHPDALEIPYNLVDENCDGIVEVDVDGDGQASAVAGGTDCDDGNAEVFVGQVEFCDGIDNDCDGLIDDEDPEGVATSEGYFLDSDLDGFPDDFVLIPRCEPGELYVLATEVTTDVSDCAPTDPLIFPGAVEVPYNTVDEDCDGAALVDVDGDGFPGGPTGTDCLDDPAAAGILPAFDVNPGATEVWGDGVDQNCDGLNDLDEDQDGHEGFGGPDCNDRDADIFPGAVELPGDAVDQNCSGANGVLCFVDGDDDSYGIGTGLLLDASVCPSGQVPRAGDCDDLDERSNPGVEDVCDGVDRNCDGVSDRGLVTSFAGNTVVENFSALGLSPRSIDASAATEIAICAETPVLDIDAGDLANRSLWIHGVEVYNDGLADSVIRASSSATQEPNAGTLILENLTFTGTHSEPVIQLEGPNQPHPSPTQLELRDVVFEGSGSDHYLEVNGPLILDTVVVTGQTNDFALVSNGVVEADGLVADNHVGLVLSIVDGVVSDVSLWNPNGLGRIIQVRGVGIFSGFEALGGVYDSLVYAHPAGDITMVTASIFGGSAEEAPLWVLGSLTLADVTLLNTRGVDAGAIHGSVGASVTMANSRIEGASSDLRGGAVQITDGVFVMTDSSIMTSRAPAQGGALFARDSSVAIIDSSIQGNVADFGGGVYLLNSTLTAVGRVDFRGNMANVEGGGAYLSGSSLDAATLVLVDNSAPESGGGLFGDDPTRAFRVETLSPTGNQSAVGSLLSHAGEVNLRLLDISSSNDDSSFIHQPASGSLFIADAYPPDHYLNVQRGIHSFELDPDSVDYYGVECLPSEACRCSEGYGCD